MANWLTQLIGKSPFAPLIDHQQAVRECAHLVSDLVEVALADKQDEVRALAKRLSRMEYDADQVKNRVRDGLPKSLFLPVARVDLLEVLAAQDMVADCAEDVGVLLTMRPLRPPPEPVAELLTELVNTALSVVDRSTEVVNRLEALANASFSGSEAKLVLGMIDQVDREEHLADKVQDRLAKTFFRHEDEFKPAEIFLWMKLFNKIGDLANFSERMTHRIRLFVAK